MLASHCFVQSIQTLFQLFRILFFVRQGERLLSFFLRLLLRTYFFSLPKVNELAEAVPAQKAVLARFPTSFNAYIIFKK